MNITIYNMKDGTKRIVSTYVGQYLVNSDPETYTMDYDKYRKAMESPQYEKYKKEELIKLANETGIELPKNITKNEIIKKLKEI